MAELNNPHDRFFKESFSRPDVARDFLLHYLPKDVIAELDLSHLEIRKDSYIDEDLQQHFTDLLYEVGVKNGLGAHVYLLFEHKSGAEWLVAFQLLRYMVHIWEQDIRDGRKVLTPILPLVVYHGREKWQAGLNFGSLFSGPESLRSYWPEFFYRLYDLSRYQDDEIKGAVRAQVTLLILKHSFDRNLIALLPDYLKRLNDLDDAKASLDYLGTIIRYVMSITPKLEPGSIAGVVNQAFPQTGGEMMSTLLDQLLEEGEERGIVKASRDNLITILETRFGPIPQPLLEIIQTIQDIRILRSLLKKAVTTESLTAFRAELL